MNRLSPKTKRTQHWFSAKGREIYCEGRPLVMGVVNVTTDSFYDGGRYVEPERAIDHALELVGQGADILDVGGESTRPGADSVSEEDELARVIPVVKGLVPRVPVPISIDTAKSRVAEVALDCGASIINDVSALRQDPAMASVIARADAGIILMHMQGSPLTMQQSPRYSDVVGEVRHFLDERLQAALRAGIARTNIILDPGFGFGKLLHHNLELLRQLPVLTALDRPLLVGLSRKAFIGKVVDRPVEHREWGTAAAVALAVDRGAHIVRVHDVAMMIDVVKIAAALSPRWSCGGQECDA
ncbi:MAG TPA: dihydropteroate synthase [Nitrospira sp.]|nr:dihydropteroate synthase [Nitrospira sp.]